jgi:hypothetical protein
MARITVRVPLQNMQYAARIRAENRVEFGEDFFCHWHSRVLPAVSCTEDPSPIGRGRLTISLRWVSV